MSRNTRSVSRRNCAPRTAAPDGNGGPLTGRDRHGMPARSHRKKSCQDLQLRALPIVCVSLDEPPQEAALIRSCVKGLVGISRTCRGHLRTRRSKWFAIVFRRDLRLRRWAHQRVRGDRRTLKHRLAEKICAGESKPRVEQTQHCKRKIILAEIKRLVPREQSELATRKA